MFVDQEAPILTPDISGEDYKQSSFINPFTSDSAKYKIDKFSKVTIWVKLKNNHHHSKVLLDGFPMNGHTLEFYP